MGTRMTTKTWMGKMRMNRTEKAESNIFDCCNLLQCTIKNKVCPEKVAQCTLLAPEHSQCWLPAESDSFVRQSFSCVPVWPMPHCFSTEIRKNEKLLLVLAI